MRGAEWGYEMRLIATAAIVVLTVISGPNVHAQKPSAPKWCTDILAKNPTPTSIPDVYDRTKAAVQPKGEFETTAEFEQRAQKIFLSLKASSGDPASGGHIVVSAPAISTYDADKGQFQVGLLSILPITGPNELQTTSGALVQYELVATEGRHVSSGEYLAQNAHGVTRTVISETRDQYGVALANLRPSKNSSWLRGTFTLKMAPKQAAAIDGKLRVLIIGDLTSPGTIDGISRSRPTVQNPMDVLVNKRYVAMTAVCGGIVAAGTGELLHRLN